ncbi:hypothetical protein SLEP1_g44830 [Rubroshorea leprosula]|uniref:Uncharacterized protein n=1 Tax=Rubroshorea leprosula TaxID=152421 RepID=A0AAV5LIS0_9ROSI|nr:hypothetical protein SLEP1_g44830 [Rubroshorea leprosula]
MEMEMEMEISCSSGYLLIHSMVFQSLAAGVRSLRFVKNPIPSTPRICKVIEI